MGTKKPLYEKLLEQQTKAQVEILNKFKIIETRDKKRWFGIGLQPMRQKKEAYNASQISKNMGKTLKEILSELKKQKVSNVKDKAKEKKSKVNDFLIGKGAKNLSAKGNVIAASNTRGGKNPTLAGFGERWQNRLKMVQGQFNQANKGSADKKNPIADGFKSMLKMAVGASILGVIGKKLFDSSPLLQAMMKLFNTSVMLIFRPIGDFIGGFLRPLMLFFMKNIAIPFYKMGKGLGNIGEMYGKQALGFLLKPQETLYAALVRWASEIPLLNSMYSDADKHLAKSYSGVADWQLDALVNAGRLDDKQGIIDHIATQETGWDSIKDWLETMMGGTTGMGMSTGITSDSTKGIGGKFIETIQEDAEMSSKWMEDVESFFLKIKNSGEVTADDAAEFSRLVGLTATHAGDGAKSMEYMDSMLRQLSDNLQTRLRATGMSMPTTSTGQRSAAAQQMINQSGVLTSLLSPGEAHGWGYDGVPQPKSGNSIVDRLGVYGKMGTDVLAKSNVNWAYSKYGNKKLLADSKTATDDDGNLIIDNRTLEEKLKAENYNSDGSLKTWMDYASDPKVASEWMSTSATANLLHNSGVQIGMAHGGVINEEIFGVGRSGKRYRFGEMGSEVVTPVNKSGGVGNIININIGNISKDADFAKLKPLIQRWILEANSRRGIV